MCETGAVRRWTVRFVLIAGVLGSRVLGAQSVAEYSQRVDSLALVWRTAVAHQIKAEASGPERMPSDTLRVGNFVILADSEHRALARATAERTSPILDRAYGDFAARVRSHVFVVRPRTPRPGDGPDPIESGIVDAQGVLRLASGEISNVDALTKSWQGKAEQMVSQDLPPNLRDWLQGAIPSDTLTVKSLSDDRVELVLSRSRVSHDCALGSIERCSQALGLTQVDDPAFALFNESERMDMLQRNEVRLRRSDPSLYSRCTVAHVQAMCDSLVHMIPRDAVPWATQPVVRRSLVRYALMIGGPGAFDRLATTDGTVSERISAAAKIPTDSVLRRWRTALVESKGTSTAIDLETALSAMCWAAACGALALRSSRWR